MAPCLRIAFFILTAINIHAVISNSDANGKCWQVLVTSSDHLQCNLENIPDDYFDKYGYLKSLVLTNSKIKRLPSRAFTGLDCLESLNLNDNELIDLPDGVFEPLTNVTEIGISRNNLSSIDFNQFVNNSVLQKLHLQKNMIETIKTIHNESEICITELSLQDNKLVDISELCKLKDLTTLRLSNNPNLDFTSVSFNCWNQLKELHLDNTNLKSLKNNYQTFAGLKKLSFLDLGKNGLKFFCVVNFPELPALELLFIDNNMLRTLNVTELNIKFKKLKTIVLSGNHWNCADLEAIENSLKNFQINFHYSQGLRCVDENVPGDMSELDECK